MVDIEKLISLVYEKTPLWNSCDQSYHNRIVSKELWNEIADELGSSSQNVKIKWQNLRDNFRKEHKKTIALLDCGSSAKPTPQWKYYEHLTFLVDAFSNRKSYAHYAHPSSDTSSVTKDDFEPEDDPISTDCTAYLEPDLLLETPADNQTNDVGSTKKASLIPQNAQFKRKKCDAESDAVSQLLSLEERILQHLEKSHADHRVTNEDEDYHFLMSLLPHLRDIPKRQKLAVRTKLQQVLMEEGSD